MGKSKEPVDIMGNGHNNSSVAYFVKKKSQEDYNGLHSLGVLILEDNHKEDQCNIYTGNSKINFYIGKVEPFLHKCHGFNCHQVLSGHNCICITKLTNQLRRFKKTTEVLKEYDTIIND